MSHIAIPGSRVYEKRICKKVNNLNLYSYFSYPSKGNSRLQKLSFHEVEIGVENAIQSRA